MRTRAHTRIGFRALKIEIPVHVHPRTGGAMIVVSMAMITIIENIAGESSF